MNPHRISESVALLGRWQQCECAEHFPLYTAYLQSLANGERLKAVHQYLRPLIAELLNQSHAARLQLVEALCRAVDHRGRKAGTSPVPGLPYELLEEVAIPTLLNQRRLHPEDAYAHLWLAILPIRHPVEELLNPRELLELAHRLAPTDEFIVERLADERLESVAFACHHLPAALLASPVVIAREIAELRQLASLLGEERRGYLVGQASSYAEGVEQFVQSRGQANATNILIDTDARQQQVVSPKV